jgi:uncharacterized membrane protein (UPF0127 family)
MAKTNFSLKYLCDDDTSRREGLMHKPELKNNECAFFIFPKTACHAFWNKNVSFDIELIFINDKFRIVDICELKSFSEEPIYPKSREIKYVIEVKRGICENCDVNIGDFVDFDSEKGEIQIKEGTKK